jgi:hypothetical protein
MKYFLWFVVWGSIILTTAFAQSAPTTSQETIPQRTYCEYSFERTSQGVTHYGIYVDPDGKFYRFRYQPSQREVKKWQPLTRNDAEAISEAVADTNVSEQKLESNYSEGRTFIRQIKPEEWQAKLKLLAEASKGQMSKPQEFLRGAGAFLYRCFVYNENSKRYQEVKLRISGTWRSDNSSPSAKELADWLELLRLEAHPELKSGLPIQTKFSQ